MTNSRSVSPCVVAETEFSLARLCGFPSYISQFLFARNKIFNRGKMAVRGRVLFVFSAVFIRLSTGDLSINHIPSEILREERGEIRDRQ